ncbi:MAG: glycosyltransferase [Conexivisphaera sp.]
MTENIKVCVFIRAYNSEKFIENAINSVFRQNFNGDIFLKILYDEGSTDNSYNKILSIIEKIKRKGFNAEIIRHPHTTPFRALINYGLKNSIELCDYFAILDYDNFWDESYLAEAVKTIRNMDFLYSNPIVINESNEKIGFLVRKHLLLNDEQPLLRRYIILIRNFIDAISIFMSRKCAKIVLDRLELLRSKTFDWIFEDWAIGAVALYFCNVIKMAQSLVYYRVHGSNITANNKVANADMTNFNRGMLTVFGFRLLIYDKMNFTAKIVYLFITPIIMVRKICRLRS